jgi:phage terminase small subunit
MEPPKSLKKQGRQLWQDVINGWEIPPEMRVLVRDLCESQDRITELTEILRKEGQIIRDRFGIQRPHPAAVLLKGEIGNFTRLHKTLMLEAPSGTDSRPGRPDGWHPED